MSGSPRNIGALLNAIDALRPVLSAAAGSYGLAGIEVDRTSAGSMLWVTQTGAVAGAPSAVAVDSKLQHRNSSAESWVDVPVSIANPAVAIAQITAANTTRTVRIDFSTLKANVRAVTQVAFTGGTSPTIAIAQQFVLDRLIET